MAVLVLVAAEWSSAALLMRHANSSSTHLANLTVVAFLGTKPVWNWIWNIFMEAICRRT